MALRLVPWSGWIGCLLAVSIVTWHRPQATAVAYNVAEHRLDYIKLGEGREYNYHYNDGVASGFDKRKFYKRPQLFSKPPYTLKSFPGPVEQIVTNEFQAHPEQTYVKQESLLPVYESHEKSVRYIPLDFGPSRNQILGEFSLPVGYPTSPPLTSNLAQRVIQMIQLHHPSSVKNATSGGLGSVSSVHFQVPGQAPSSSYYSTQHPGSYQYFNAHPVPSGGPAYELLRPISSFPPPRPYLAPALTTTRAPYLAPILHKSTTTTPAPPTGESKPSRRPPTPAPSRPYVAPGVTADPLLSSVSLANRLKYTSSQRPTSPSSRPLTQQTGGTRNQQPYEPEFDIDIRIDLRDDSA